MSGDNFGFDETTGGENPNSNDLSGTEPVGNENDKMLNPDKTKKDTVQTPVQIDEFAENMFVSLGFEKPLPAKLTVAYNTFKKLKDRMQPGRLSAEGFATVILLASGCQPNG